MLIVCPNCASSYMIDQASVGPAGRTVRCARCKETWLAGAPESVAIVTAAADNAVAAAEAQSAPPARAGAAPPPAAPEPPPATAAPPSQPEQAADSAVEEPESITATAADVPPPEPPPPQPVATEAPATVPAEIQAPESEPATIADAPPLVPPIEHEPLPDAAAAEPDSEDAESFDARRHRLQGRSKKSVGSSRWTAIILVLASFNVALVGARKDVVRYLPQTASLFAAVGLPVNLRGLKFEDVKISMEEQNGVATLIVQGEIVSDTGKPVAVPRLRFAARNSTGQEVYTWTMPPPRSILGPGERLEFRSQIPAPPAGAKDVIVRFVTAQDAAAGAK